jgi:orotidine-5'-phosphate decarboxylase
MAELIVALDVPTAAEAEKAAKALAPKVGFFKVGLELFTAEGPKAVEAVKKHGKVFLDLKLHDIPNTVAGAVKSAGRLGVDALSIHFSGGLEMLQAAAAVSPRPRLWGITVLTSLRDLSHLGSPLSAAEAVGRLAALGKQAGFDGAVCSGEEIGLVKGLGLQAVVPGIRPASSKMDDQKRAVSPGLAVKRGADYLVVGRPVLQASDPAQAAEKIMEEMHASR